MILSNYRIESQKQSRSGTTVAEIDSELLLEILPSSGFFFFVVVVFLPPNSQEK